MVDVIPLLVYLNRDSLTLLFLSLRNINVQNAILVNCRDLAEIDIFAKVPRLNKRLWSWRTV